MIRHPTACGLVLAAVTALVTGCTQQQPAAGNAPPTATQTVTVGTTTAPAPTLTSIAPGVTITAVPPPSTSEAAPVDGQCPYLADEVVAEINGQRTGTTKIIAGQPYPVCIFSRTDGEWLASVRVITADTPQSAVAAVDAHVPIGSSDPASQPPGWTGGSMVTDSGSVYAVAKGNVAIVAESNQPQSIKGRQLVIETVGNLGL